MPSSERRTERKLQGKFPLNNFGLKSLIAPNTVTRFFDTRRSFVFLCIRKMANQPCRQLNSAAIRGEVLANIIPLVRSKCSILGVKSIWPVQGGASGIQSAWHHIVSKRNQCDAVVCRTSGVAFFFSAISTYQSNMKSEQVNNEDEKARNSNSESQLSGQSTGTSQVYGIDCWHIFFLFPYSYD